MLKTAYPTPESHPEDTKCLDDWKKELLTSSTSARDLVERGLVTADEAQHLEAITRDFKLRITPYYAQLIENSPDCPIRKQAIPNLGEVDPELPEWASQWSQKIYGRTEPWHPDPIGDLNLQAAPRLTHRYPQRAILHLSSMCAVYCRFCFRKSHLNDESRTLYEGGLQPAFDYLQDHPEISELILTGGDPLSLTDSMLERVFRQVDQIPSVRVIRIHSRMAVTLPSRFSESLLRVLAQNWGFSITLVSHFNHPKELTELARKKLKLLRQAGVTLLNQCVLMRGVNASLPTLQVLFQSLYENGVIPFYLHHPDWTPGTFHFRVSVQQGQDLMRELRGRVSGPALPSYVLDIPQGLGKTSLLDGSVEKIDEYRSTSLIGAIYELSGPNTRNGRAQKSRYLDLAPLN